MNAKKLVMAELLSLAAAYQMQHIGVFGNGLALHPTTVFEMNFLYR